MRIVTTVLLTSLAIPMSVLAMDTRTYTVPEILELSEAPDGVVFEIVSNDDAMLANALPKMQEHVAELRARFPSVRVAVVSHGLESFALMRQYRDAYPTAHDAARALTSTDGVSLHVCSKFTSAHGIAAGAFLPYVDASSEGPQQVEQYRKQGYLHVEMDSPTETGDLRFCPLPDNYLL